MGIITDIAGIIEIHPPKNFDKDAACGQLAISVYSSINDNFTRAI